MGFFRSLVRPSGRPGFDSLLARMTLEEKVGEMTQLTSMMVSSTRGTPDTVQQLDSVKLDDALLLLGIRLGRIDPRGEKIFGGQ